MLLFTFILSFIGYLAYSWAAPIIGSGLWILATVCSIPLFIEFFNKEKKPEAGESLVNTIVFLLIIMISIIIVSRTCG